MRDRAAHVVQRLWIRPAQGPTGVPQEQSTLVLEAERGIVGDHTHGRMRHVTFVFADDWAAACRALGQEVDPSARRANVLLSGGDGTALIGRTVRIGAARIHIRKETTPCPVMDRAAEGLQAALRPAGRGGVWGRVLQGGVIEPGAVLEIEDPG